MANKRNYTLVLKKKKKNSFVVAVIKKRGKVLEKLGVYNPKLNSLSLNIFRLIFWVSKNISVSGHVFNILVKFNILSNNSSKKIDV